MNKCPAKTAATRQRFIDVFCMLYAEKPLEKITVKEIAEAAGYNRVTFYEYFKDAYDILDTLETEFFEFIDSTITRNIRSGNMLENFSSVFEEIFREKKTIASLLFTGSCSGATIQHCKDRLMPEFLLSFDVETDDLYGRYLLEFYLSGVISVMCHWVTAEERLPVEELGRMIKNILQGGILPQLL